MNGHEDGATYRDLGKEKRIKRVAREILQHLAVNPNAADTVEGIAQWWLLGFQVEVETRTVEQALDYLLQQQWIVAVRAANHRTHYHLHPDRREEIETLFPSE